jgi:hypothetical protein
VIPSLVFVHNTLATIIKKKNCGGGDIAYPLFNKKRRREFINQKRK